MRIAIVDTNPRSGKGISTAAPYAVSLLKLGAWRKALGDEVSKIYRNKLPAAGSYDQIWLTTLFTYDIPHASRLITAAKKRCSKVVVGGVAATLLPDRFRALDVEVHEGLQPDAERFSPDYSLVPEGEEVTSSITYTSRGCVRDCAFCMVPKLEPKFTRRGWVDDMAPGKTHLLFYDNNWLGKPLKEMEEDVEAIEHLYAEDRIIDIDMNQGLDARLVKESKAKLLERIPWNYLRFAFDGMHADGHWQNAVRMMAKRGQRDVRSYVLYNFTDHPTDFWYRLRQQAILTAELDILVRAFPMRYKSIMEPDTSKDYVGPNWTRRQRDSVGTIMGAMSGPSGMAHFGGPHYTPLEEFEFWFGETESEFVRFLNYPRLKELCQVKKGESRILRRNDRATAKEATRRRLEKERADGKLGATSTVVKGRQADGRSIGAAIYREKGVEITA